MTCGQLTLARAAATGGGRTYLVHNSQHPSLGERGAFHGFDLLVATEGDDAKADLLRDAWHEFAASGRVSMWEPIDAAKPWSTVVMENNQTQNKRAWKASECEFWTGHGFGPEFWWSN